MREIKFRAWFKPNKMMYQVGQVTLEKGTWTYESDNKENIGVCVPYQPSFILMQYTGLKDKNGKEIYEGDIVEDYFYERKAKVVFLEGAFWLDYIKDFKKYGTIHKRYQLLANYDNKTVFEVIGNIYENSNLLEKEIK